MANTYACGCEAPAVPRSQRWIYNTLCDPCLRRSRTEARATLAATPHQLDVIVGCARDGRWFDVFDGMAPAPTETQIVAMSREEASRLVGIIVAAGV